MAEHKKPREAVIQWRELLETALDNAEDIAAGRATEMEDMMRAIIEESKTKHGKSNT